MENTVNQNFRCLYCDGEDYIAEFDAPDFDSGLDKFTVACCKQCGLSQTLNVDHAVLEKAYSTQYYGSGTAKFMPLFEGLVKFGRGLQAKKILDIHGGDIDKSPAIRVLDIGCGRGALLNIFCDMGADCLGIERSEFSGSNEADFKMHIGAITDEVLQGETFDIIIVWHALEHIAETNAILKSLAHHLSPNGLVVMSVPNYSSWQSRMFKKHWFHLDLPRHLIHFKREWFVDELDRLGFRIIEDSTFSPSQNLFGFIQSTLNVLARKSPNRLYALLKFRSNGYAWLPLLGWAGLGAILLPLALLESIVVEPFKQGATLTLYAQHGKKRDTE